LQIEKVGFGPPVPIPHSAFLRHHPLDDQQICRSASLLTVRGTEYAT
jgi:hypothetical protein